MARSKIEITVPTSMGLGDIISFKTSLDSVETLFKINWVDDSETKAISDVYISSLNPYFIHYYDAIEFKRGVETLDIYGNLYVSRIGGVVTIQSSVDNLNFIDQSSTNVDVEIVVTNQDEELPVFEISSVVISEGDSPCSNVTVTVTTSVLADKITSPISLTENTDNPFSFQYIRGQKIDITVESSSLGQVFTEKVTTPQKLLSIDIFVDVINSSLGNSATINYSSSSPFYTALSLTYSIDGTTFSSSNVFTDLTAGTYTAYIKDQYGCTAQKDFVFVDNSEKTGYRYISKTNSLRFSDRLDWDYLNIYKTDENTLSSETLDDISICEIQRFQTNDVITTQMRSNYDTVSAFLIDGDTELELTVIEKRKYIGIKDYRDCVIYKIEEGKMGIYFTYGNIYDYDTSLSISEYNLKGVLPIWIKKGVVVNVDSIGLLEVNSVFFSEEKNVEVAEVGYNYTGVATLSKLKTIYDLRPYNLYEFDVDFSTYAGKSIRIKTVEQDDELDTKTRLTEVISIKTIWDNCLEIIYFNTKNGDLFYETGIENLIRLPFSKITDSPISESEIHKGDNQVFLVSAEYYEGDLIEFLPLTKELSKKLELALKHSFLSINRVNYKIAEEPEKTQLDESNLYTVKAKLIKAGDSYSINTSEQESLTTDIPEIISGGEDGFIFS